MDLRAAFAVGILIASLLFLRAGPAEAQIVEQTLFKNITAGAGSFDRNNQVDNKNHDDGPTSGPAPVGAQTLGVNLITSAGGAQSTVHGQIAFQFLSSEITAKAFMRHYSKASGESASALAGFDAVVSFQFDVGEQSEYGIFGWVKSDRDLDGPELVACQRNGVVLAGDTRATPYPLGLQMFKETRTVFPNDPTTIECGLVASGSAVGGANETEESEGLVEWRFALRFSAAGPTCADTNGDGETTATDALATLRAAVGLANCELAVCDVNGSGSVSATDALGVLTMAVDLPFAWDCPIG